MSVKYTNFVEININHHISTNPIGLRDTAAVIFCSSGAAIDTTLTKTTEIPSALTAFEDYITAFFDNGGRKLHCITTNLAPTADGYTELIENLPMEEIVVALIDKSGSYGEDTFRPVAKAYNTSKGSEKIYQKIFVVEVPYDDSEDDDQIENTYIDAEGKKKFEQENYVIKFGAFGISASVLAYYTQMRIYSTDSAEDYCYTKEKYEGTGYVFNSNKLVSDAMLADINIDINLANAVRNIGGNDMAGYSLTNQYMLLVMHQTLTIQLINLLAQKIKYNSQGLAAVITTISAELNRYVANGFLSTNKTWVDGDLDYEGYRIIDNNTLLNLGYKVAILPFETLTPEEKEAKQLPKIFILVADTYGIKKIVINGELF